MQSISLNKPHHFSHEILYPSEWNELTAAEMEIVAHAQMASGQSEAVAKALILTGILDERAKAQNIPLPNDWKEKLNVEDAVIQGFDGINFLYNENERTVNPFPELYIGSKNKRVIGPADDFNEILCGEMEDCEVFFHQIIEKPTKELLARLAAVLWRPRNAPYDPKALEKRAIPFEDLSLQKLLAIFIWYTGCRNQLPKSFPDVYGGGEAGEPDVSAFTKCIHAGAGPKNGTREEIRRMEAKEFLFDMQLEAKHAQELKEEYAANK